MLLFVWHKPTHIYTAAILYVNICVFVCVFRSVIQRAYIMYQAQVKWKKSCAMWATGMVRWAPVLLCLLAPKPMWKRGFAFGSFFFL